MKSTDAGFRQVAPVVDRVFRFIEMIGITALLAVLFPDWAQVIRLIGTEAALYFLFEPLVDAFAFWIVPEVKGGQDILRISVLTALGFFGLMLASGPVSLLAEQVARTITVSR